MDAILLLAATFYFAYNNGTKANVKGYNAIGWGILTLVAVFIGYMISVLFVVLVFLGKSVDLNALAQTNNAAAQQQLKDSFVKLIDQNPAHLLFILLGCFGGYLLIRYIIEKLPYKK